MTTLRIGTASAFLTLIAALAAAAMQEQPAPVGPVATCTTARCHADVLAHRVLHTPVMRNKCGACHEATDPSAHRFSTTVPATRLCTTCHVQRHRTFVHEPVSTGNCVGCHDPHGSEHRFHLLDDPAEGLCYRCHDRAVYEEHEHVHGPVAAGACIACHDAHSSWNWKLLAVPVDELCDLCHAGVSDGVLIARHVHPPLRDGSCMDCHDPHASEHEAQLLRDPAALCTSCHAAIEREIDGAAHVHGALDSERSCVTCHDGHASVLPHLLANPPLNLCLSCHDESLRTSEGRVLTNMAALLAGAPDHHGPIRRADCSACHDPHTSSNVNLLSKPYPPMFYAPFDVANYELCFSCHLTELATEPRGEEITGFRDGEKNLHFVHVNMERRGRTCRACHEVHASRRPFHIRESVPYGTGGWELEINFEVTAQGGSCAPGCHPPRSYTRSVTSAAGLGTKGDTAEDEPG